jgi:DNA-binding transcriptional MocR family regulator
MDVDGWDLDAVSRVIRQAKPALAYVIPDFQNPTGNLMGEEQRGQYAALLRRTGTIAVVDESHQALRLDGAPMPRPFASYAQDAVTLGSASKSLWGGLRIGWIRCPTELTERLVQARVALDLGSPVLEQLVAARLLAAPEAHWRQHRARLLEQRDALAAALAERLPDWRFRLPEGGLSLWCELPTRDRRAGAAALAAEAEARAVAVSPGPVFALDGGLDSFVRIPYTRPAPALEDAVDRLAESWAAVTSREGARPGRTARVMVA